MPISQGDVFCGMIWAVALSVIALCFAYLKWVEDAKTSSVGEKVTSLIFLLIVAGIDYVMFFHH